MLGALNEKKALICFASGLTLNGLDNQAQLRATVNDAIRAGVQVWSIDARGLVALLPLGDATHGAGMYTGAAAGAMLTSFQRSQDTLCTLAADTGGKALFDYNDLASAIGATEKSITGYYIIGYYTTNLAGACSVDTVRRRIYRKSRGVVRCSIADTYLSTASVSLWGIARLFGS